MKLLLISESCWFRTWVEYYGAAVAGCLSYLTVVGQQRDMIGAVTRFRLLAEDEVALILLRLA